ncbi:MAG: hypothetical protein GX221_05375 [Candidatus Riflebacteria bacterium]|nr:hypothetical protein [Candidatus Riflebacteria bacterium]
MTAAEQEEIVTEESEKKRSDFFELKSNDEAQLAMASGFLTLVSAIIAVISIISLFLQFSNAEPGITFISMQEGRLVFLLILISLVFTYLRQHLQVFVMASFALFIGIIKLLTIYDSLAVERMEEYFHDGGYFRSVIDILNDSGSMRFGFSLLTVSLSLFLLFRVVLMILEIKRENLQAEREAAR